MKKIMFTAMAAVAMFAMVACNNNKTVEATEDTVCTDTIEQCEHQCMHEGDSAMCCKAEGVAEEHACCAKEGEECEHKCQKAQ